MPRVGADVADPVRARTRRAVVAPLGLGRRVVAAPHRPGFANGAKAAKLFGLGVEIAADPPHSISSGSLMMSRPASQMQSNIKRCTSFKVTRAAAEQVVHPPQTLHLVVLETPHAAGALHVDQRLEVRNEPLSVAKPRVLSMVNSYR